MSKITSDFRLSALRNGVVVRSARNFDVADNIRHAALVEMLNLGFMVDHEGLKGMSKDALSTMIADARIVVGADRQMRPIYPGFPNQVKNLDTATLWWEQIVHYWSGGTLLPNYPDTLRKGLPLEDAIRASREVKVLTAGEAASHFIRTLTTKGVAMSEDERTLLRGSVALSVPTLDEVAQVTAAARNGENMQALFLALEVHGNYSASDMVVALAPSCKNADQLLRLVLAVSTVWREGREADYELAVNTLADRKAGSVKMVNLSRPARRVLLERLGAVTDGFKADSLLARELLWRRVMRMVHPYDLSMGEGTKRALDIIHANVEHRTFNSLVETGMAEGDVDAVVGLLAEHQPGNLLRRLVSILRLCKNARQVKVLSDAVRSVGSNAAITTLVSAYNGVIAVNDDHARVTRVAGLRNAMLAADERKINTKYVAEVAEALKDALKGALARKDAPSGSVGVNSDRAVPLVRRDLSSTDRVMDRGQLMAPVGKGDTVRLFSHWRNNQNRSGYIDVGAVALDDKFNALATVTWNSWQQNREWSTYSGDCHVHPGKSAAEYIDVDVPALKKAHPKAAWVAMTLQSWSGFPMDTVDMIAGTMLRSKPNSGQVFEPRSVTSAFKPTTTALQAVPLVFNLETGEMCWLDSSSGSDQQGVSAVNDGSVGSVVYDEVARPRLTMGELATLWAEAHGAEVTDEAVDRESVLGLLD